MNEQRSALNRILWLCGLIAGCATGGSRPIDFLDEHTAASIVVVARPIAFAHPRLSVAANVFEFVDVTAVAVDLNGKLDFLLVSHAWSTAGPDLKDRTGGAGLVLVADDRRIGLGDSELTLRESGVSESVQKAAGLAPASAISRTDLETLRFIAAAHSLAVDSAAGAPYALFDDGRWALAQFVQQETASR